jgi:VIT1/CCC1 family predicted Fe2+/Mn2+ transporter
MSVDPVWAEYYRDNMDAAGLHRVMGGFERPAARRGIFERHVAVANAHVEWALDTKVQEDLGVRPPSAGPLTDVLATGTATTFGARIPLVPVLTRDSGLAIWGSLRLAMLAQVAIGPARSVFTDRGFWSASAWLRPTLSSVAFR